MWSSSMFELQVRPQEEQKTSRMAKATRAGINDIIFIYYIIYSILADNKQKIISDIYFDRNGYGSKATTLKDAREKDKTITLKDVEQFFRKNVEVKAKPRGYNSFIAPYNHYTYQIDLFLWDIMILMKSKSSEEG